MKRVRKHRREGFPRKGTPIIENLFGSCLRFKECKAKRAKSKAKKIERPAQKYISNWASHGPHNETPANS